MIIMIYDAFNASFEMILNICYYDWQHLEIIIGNELWQFQKDHNWRIEYDYIKPVKEKNINATKY